MADATLRFDTKIDLSSMDKGLQQANLTAKKAFGNIAKSALALTAAMATTAVAVVGVGSSYEAAMSQVAATLAIVDRSSESFTRLSAAAQEAGRTTPFSASQAADALNELALAGLNVEHSIAGLEGTLNLAAAGGLTLGHTANMVTDVMAIWKKEADELVDVADLLTVANQNAAQTVADFGAGIISVGGTATMLTDGLEGATAALAILADNGIKAAEGGTMLRNVIMNLTATTGPGAEQLKALGINAYDASGAMRPLEDTISDLNNALDGMTDQRKSDIINRIFDRSTVSAANALLSTSTDRWNELGRAFSDVAGSAERTGRIMKDNLRGDLMEVQSALEGLGIQLFESFTGPFREAAQAGVDSIGLLSRELASPKMQRSIESIAQGMSELARSGFDLATNIIPPLVSAFSTGIDLIVKNGPVIQGILVGIAAKMTAAFALPYIGTLISGISAANKSLALYSGALKNTAIYGNMAAAAATAQLKSMSALAVAYGAATGKIKLQTAAQVLATKAKLAFNLAWAASPFGMIALAFGAVVGAITFFNRAMSKATEETRRAREEAQAYTQALKDQQAAIRDNAEAFHAQNREFENNAAIAEGAMQTIERLASVENKSNDEKQQMIRAVTKLNTLYPDLNLNYQIETDRLNMSTQAMRTNIEERNNMVRQLAAMEEMIRLQKELFEVEKQYEEAQKERARAKEINLQIEKAYYQINAAIMRGNIALAASIKRRVSALEEEYDAIMNNYAVTSESMRLLEEQMESMGNVFSEVTDDIISNVENIDIAMKQPIKTVAELQNAVKLFQRAVDESASSTGLSVDTIFALIDAGYASVIMYDEVTGAAHINREGMEDLTRAKIDARIVSLRLAQAMITEEANALIQVARNVDEQRNAYLALAAAKRMAASEGERSFSELEAEIRGFQQLANSASQYVARTSAASRGAGRAVETAFQAARKAIEDYRKDLDYTMERELEMWKDISENVQMTAEERIEVMRTIRRMESDLLKQGISEAKHYGQIRTQDIITLLRQEAEKYAENSDIRRRIERDIFNYEQQLRRENFDRFRQDLDNRRFFAQISLQEEIAMLDEHRQHYAAGTEERKRLDREYFTARQNQSRADTDREKRNISDLISSWRDMSRGSVEIQAESSRERIELIDQEFLKRIQWVRDEDSTISDAKHRQTSAEFDRHRERLANLHEERVALIENLALQNQAAFEELQAIQGRREELAAEKQAERDLAREKTFINRRSDIFSKMAVADAEELVKLQEQLAALERDEAAWRREIAEREYLAELTRRERDLRATINENINKARDAAREYNDEVKNTVAMLTELLERGAYGEIRIPISLEWLDARDEEFIRELGSLFVEDMTQTITAVVESDIDMLTATGLAIDQAVAKGIDDNLGIIEDSAAGIIDAVVKGAADELDQLGRLTVDLYQELRSRMDDRPWRTLGFNMTTGMIDGVLLGTQPLVNAVKAAIQAALAGAHHTMQVGLGMMAANLGLSHALSPPMSFMPMAAPESAYGRGRVIHNHYYQIYPQYMTYSDHDQFIGELSRSLRTAGV